MTDPDLLPAGAVRAALRSQYHAALAMLRDAVERCPDERWTDDGHRNACWQLAYHALFFTHLYLGRDEASFRPWEHHRADAQHPDGIPGPADPGSTLPLLPPPYTRTRVLAYADFCDAMVDDAVAALDLASPESGFSWYRIPKLEHQLVSIRHLQHHAAQLADRVRAARDEGVRWVKSVPDP